MSHLTPINKNSDDAGVQLDYSKFVRNITVKAGKKWVRWVVGLETPFTPNVRWVGPDGGEINSNVNKYELEHKKLKQGKVQGKRRTANARWIILCITVRQKINRLFSVCMSVWGD